MDRSVGIEPQAIGVRIDRIIGIVRQACDRITTARETLIGSVPQDPNVAAPVPGTVLQKLDDLEQLANRVSIEAGLVAEAIVG